MPLATILSRALSQFDDRVFLGVVLRAVAWSALCFALLHLLAVALVREFVAWEGPTGWIADIVAYVGASLLSMWLFVPTAAAIATLYVDRIAAAVEQRFYPDLPPAPGAPVAEQVMDALALAGRMLGLGIVALVLILTIPGIGLACGWAITGYALGRGLFLSVAMRRMPRPEAMAVYRRHRWTVLAPGLVIAIVVWVPVLNLFVPVIAAAAMVHALDAIMRGR
jgi:CysZ protein